MEADLPMPIDDLKDQNAAHKVSDASDVPGHRAGDRHEVAVGADQPTAKDEAYRKARIMAREGYGHEDICVKLRSIPREHARMMVLGRRFGSSWWWEKDR